MRVKAEQESGRPISVHTWKRAEYEPCGGLRALARGAVN
ncbi:hypothetical protein BSU04_26765 [Caballeronia sordidicola]|uniref:Uncharacterized protein n=1 Tax=Caballeronia sordidicola TaxID=196367 RepID=A0A226WXW6_CABSO|nr:hypothetical protein BSU04_26765 [Caballeronia sordidicola]